MSGSDPRNGSSCLPSAYRTYGSHLVLVTLIWFWLSEFFQGKSLRSLARPERFELPTPRFVVGVSEWTRGDTNRADPTKRLQRQPIQPIPTDTMRHAVTGQVRLTGPLRVRGPNNRDGR
jgi:hypothetical protein